MWNKVIQDKAKALRVQGKTYPEIQRILRMRIPKSTFSFWFRNISLTSSQKKKINDRNLKILYRSRLRALATIARKRKQYLESVEKRVSSFNSSLNIKKTGKIVLAILNLTEGSHTTNGSVTFGNSDPHIISLFLRLLRFCYTIDENKLRCTVQCRADQDIRKLEDFWRRVTGITSERFYKAQVDQRTVGKPTKKPNYHGVCRINYFSGDLALELRAITKVIHKGPVV